MATAPFSVINAPKVNTQSVGEVAGVSLPGLNDLGITASEAANSINQQQSGVFNDYFAALQGRDKPLDIYQSLNQEAGIPELRKTSSSIQGEINNLEDTLRRVETNVNATTKNSFVTEGQRSGMVETRRQPLLENLSTLGTALSRVEGDISKRSADIKDIVSLALQGQEMDLEPFRAMIDLASEQAARAMTGFTADQQNQLDILLKKADMGFELTMQERQMAHDLAIAEKRFEQEKQLMKEQAEQVRNSTNTQIVTANGRQYLIDMNTGQRVADLGSSKAPSSGSSGSVINPNKYINTPSTVSEPPSYFKAIG